MANSYLDKTGLAYLWGKIKALIPTKTSDITNDSGYVTSTEVAQIVGMETYYDWTSGSHDADSAPVGTIRVKQGTVASLPWTSSGAYGFLVTIGGEQKLQVAVRTNASGIHSVYMRHYNTSWYPWATIYDSTATYTNVNEVNF